MMPNSEYSLCVPGTPGCGVGWIGVERSVHANAIAASSATLDIIAEFGSHRLIAHLRAASL
jgi:hypothetical protein